MVNQELCDDTFSIIDGGNTASRRLCLAHAGIMGTPRRLDGRTVCSVKGMVYY